MFTVGTVEPYRTVTSLIHAEGSPVALNTFKLLTFLIEYHSFEAVIVIVKDVWPLFLVGNTNT